VIQRYADMALRTLGIAYKDIEYTSNYATLNENFLESDLTLVAVAGIKDPLRPDIEMAIN
jgi:magnesium-transporting ATPase (P-type)